MSSIGYNTDLVKREERAEKLRRSARSEMVGQNGEGSPGFQRRDHERNLPDRRTD